MKNQVEITPEIAAHVLFYFRGEGYEPGSFVSSLMSTIAKADQGNQLRLWLAFPLYVEAMRLAMYADGGLDKLRRIFEGKS